MSRIIELTCGLHQWYDVVPLMLQVSEKEINKHDKISARDNATTHVELTVVVVSITAKIWGYRS